MPSVLQDPDVELSTAWKALVALLGPTVAAWEFETIRLELARRRIEPTDTLMAKLFAAMTVVTTNAWTYDHDVLFAFALACDGNSANCEEHHHPTPEQLCWAIHELRAITGAPLDDDVGFDYDAIDPAIAVVLHAEGYVVAPDELSFAQHALDAVNRYGHRDEIRSHAMTAWKTLKTLPVETLHEAVAQLDEEAVEIQIQRLADCRLYVAEKELAKARRHGSTDK